MQFVPSVLIISVLCFINLPKIGVSADKRKCKMVPFETKDGLSGTCCVFFDKTSTDQELPKEEIAQQILSNKQKSDEEGANKPPAVKSELMPKESAETSHHSEDSIMFPVDGGDHKESDQDTKMNWKPRKESGATVQNVTGSVTNKETNKANVTIETKHAVDVPVKCPAGMEMDHTGGCSTPF